MNAFLTVGSTRIRKSNIKDWGVFTKSKSYPVVGKSFLYKWLVKDYDYRDVRYLKITTFQEDIFKFDADEFDISAAVKELEQSSRASK